jgi:hypothetical protein
VVDHSELEDLATRLWPDVVSAVDAIVARAEAGDWHTVPRSSLSGDDAATHPFQTSHAVQMLLNAGIDALNGVRHLIWGRPNDPPSQPVLHQAAHHVLARAAIENFATGLWILSPRKRALRVERTLRWHVKNVTDQHFALDRLSLPTTKSREDKLAQLEAVVVGAVGHRPPKFRSGYTTTEVLRYVDQTNPEREVNAFLSAQLVWQLCSGFAHGRPWASLTFQEQELLPTEDPDVLSVRLTSDMHRALLAPKEAMHLLERLLVLHQARNRPPY